MKFSQMPYERPKVDELKEKLANLLDRFREAKNAQEAISVMKEADDLFQSVESMFALSFIRHSLDTTDEYYDKENDYQDENEPILKQLQQEMYGALLETPFRKEIEEKLGTLIFRKAEMKMKTIRPEIVPDMQEENRLKSEYDKLLASAQIEFDGKTLTLAQLSPYHENHDRSVRETSMRVRAEWFLSHAEQLDSIFDQLVQVRTRMARKLGYENFIELGYYLMERLCYDQNRVKGFRKGVTEYLVPVVDRLKAEQAERIGVPTMTVYDNAFEYPDGNAKPTGTAEDIFAHGKKMYHELSAETTELIDFMLENELFDVLTRPGKSGGGYCHYINDHKSPFIFANFNGTSGDIDVLTHEAGHAFAGYFAREIFPTSLREYTYETAEVHSMSMEFFTWPWMEGFFGDQLDKYKKSHLGGALTFIPYGTMVDEFQHHIYEKPDMTPKERNDLWLELEGKYRPYLDQKDFPFYGEGRRWQAQSHIYERPFYYIDYCLAQATALAFWAEDQTNHKEAWDKYVRLVKMAGTKTFSDLLEGAGINSPFEPETLKTIADAAVKWLEAQ